MVRAIITPPDPRLRKKSKAVETIDKRIENIIIDLKETLAAQTDPEGVGLAAVQIGKNEQIFLMRFSAKDAKSHGEKNREKIVINPKIVSIDKLTKQEQDSKKEILEGCLSIPHYYGPLVRSGKVTLEYLEENGKTRTQTFTGFPAHVVLHEVDHLNGVLYIDRLLEQKKKLYEHTIDDEWVEVEI